MAIVSYAFDAIQAASSGTTSTPKGSEVLVPSARFAANRLLIFGPLKGGFAGFAGGLVQDLTEGLLTQYAACH